MAKYINKGKICSLPGCDRDACSRGLCRTHYCRLLKHGDPKVCLTTEKFAAQKFAEQAAACKASECLIWPFRRDNYGYAVLRVNGKKSVAHIRVCTIVHGEKPFDGAEVAHSCGNGHEGCVNGSHLRWASRSDNQMDRIRHGTSNRGPRHSNAKLTVADALFIQQNYGKIPTAELCSRFKVSHSVPHAIATGKNWGWLSDIAAREGGEA